MDDADYGDRPIGHPPPFHEFLQNQEAVKIRIQ